MKGHVAIIGAGVSGLSAGIYALQSGYSVNIYEKNKMPGGECTGWNRQGYHIDNCIHFLVGCNPADQLYKIWNNVGVLSEKVKVYREPYFYCMENAGINLHLWRDIERARQEFLSVAPEDTNQLNLFFDCVKGCECVKPPCDISPAHMNPFQFMKMGMSMMDAGKANREYGKQTMSEFVNRFKNPNIRALFGNYFNNNFIALTFVTSYAFYTSDTVGIPEGGSTGMISRMTEKFKALGGEIRYAAEVDRTITEAGKITRMTTVSGEEIEVDNYIWCADPHDLFYNLIGTEYLDKNLRYMYDNPRGYLSNTGYQAAFGIKKDDDMNLPEGSVIFPCEPYEVAGESRDFCGMRVYDYDDQLFPKNKRVIQCNILQNDVNYDYWKTLHQNRTKYEFEKNRIAEQLRERIETQYPQLKGNLTLLGTYSPITFTKWCNAYKGGYMSFNALKGYKSLYVKNTVKGLKNLFLGSQWVQNGGGLPIAAAGGKFAVQAMNRSKT